MASLGESGSSDSEHDRGLGVLAGFKVDHLEAVGEGASGEESDEVPANNLADTLTLRSLPCFLDQSNRVLPGR